DAGTPTVTTDDFTPKYVSGDVNNNGKLDPGETWLYTSSGVVSYQVHAGLYGNTATVTAKSTGNQTFTASDANYHFGTTRCSWSRRTSTRSIRCTRPWRRTPTT